MSPKREQARLRKVAKRLATRKRSCHRANKYHWAMHSDMDGSCIGDGLGAWRDCFESQETSSDYDYCSFGFDCSWSGALFGLDENYYQNDICYGADQNTKLQEDEEYDVDVLCRSCQGVLPVAQNLVDHIQKYWPVCLGSAACARAMQSQWYADSSSCIGEESIAFSHGIQAFDMSDCVDYDGSVDLHSQSVHDCDAHYDHTQGYDDWDDYRYGCDGNDLERSQYLRDFWQPGYLPSQPAPLLTAAEALQHISTPAEARKWLLEVSKVRELTPEDYDVLLILDEDSKRNDIMSAEEIVDLPMASNIDISDSSCRICLSTMEANEDIRMLPMCGHCFHMQCVSSWLSSQKSSCPLCSQRVLAHHQDVGVEIQVTRSIIQPDRQIEDDQSVDLDIALGANEQTFAREFNKLDITLELMSPSIDHVIGNADSERKSSGLSSPRASLGPEPTHLHIVPELIHSAHERDQNICDNSNSLVVLDHRVPVQCVEQQRPLAADTRSTFSCLPFCLICNRLF